MGEIEVRCGVKMSWGNYDGHMAKGEEIKRLFMRRVRWGSFHSHQLSLSLSLFLSHPSTPSLPLCHLLSLPPVSLVGGLGERRQPPSSPFISLLLSSLFLLLTLSFSLSFLSLSLISLSISFSQISDLQRRQESGWPAGQWWPEEQQQAAAATAACLGKTHYEFGTHYIYPTQNEVNFHLNPWWMH